MMRKLLVAVMALALAGPIPALARAGGGHAGGHVYAGGGHAYGGGWHHGGYYGHPYAWGYHPGYRWGWYGGGWGWWPLAVFGGLAAGAALSAPYYAPSYPSYPYYTAQPGVCYAPGYGSYACPPP